MSQSDVQIKVGGICCGNSIVRAQKVIKAFDEVKAVRIDLANNLAHIEGSPDPEAIVAALIGAGFPASCEPAS
ncbi:heavy-metal-associated domain-containing protein [Thiogranum longum]|uniref:Heavy-metal-associated domain-containing protein n=1 Tax=Thiogranum longum TaxID=1537524 RepID=A0A4R1HCK5_9GAMM|nr:heavy metal-associated domain-containing protein [Thiogranum longum]TCK17985.1 heavy-metal-associated domain-containing protein [Thiogranum longum]